MPVRKFYQPPGEDDIMPDAWSFRYTPLGADGFPDYPSSTTVPATITGTEFCAGEWLRSFCASGEAKLAVEEGRAYNPAIVTACTLETRTCHVAADIPDPITEGWVQAQGCVGVSCSGWGNALVVPEPDFAVLLVVGVLLLGALYERSWQRRHTRVVSGVRIKRQRSPLRRRVRQMLWRWLRMVGRSFK